MGGNVCLCSNEAAVCIGADLLRSAALQGVEVGTRHSCPAEYGLIELLAQCQRQALDQRIVQIGQITLELIGKRNDDGQRVRGHLLGGQRAALDGLLFGLADPASLRVTGDDGNGHAQTGELDFARQPHNSRALLSLLPDLAGNSAGQGNAGRAVHINGCHVKNLLS